MAVHTIPGEGRKQVVAKLNSMSAFEVISLAEVTGIGAARLAKYAESTGSGIPADHLEAIVARAFDGNVRYVAGDDSLALIIHKQPDIPIEGVGDVYNSHDDDEVLVSPPVVLAAEPRTIQERMARINAVSGEGESVYSGPNDPTGAMFRR
ncbi:hypothetical protein ACQZ5N_01020 [Agrobacterium sp. 22-221-1]